MEKSRLFRRATREDVDAVLDDIRDDDLAHLIASCGEDAVRVYAHRLVSDAAIAIVLCANEEPVAIFGCRLTAPGVADMFRFGTPRWREVLPVAVRFGRREMMPRLRAAGVTQLSAHMPLDADTDWLRLFGAKLDREYRRNGREMKVFTADLTA